MGRKFNATNRDSGDSDIINLLADPGYGCLQ